MYTEHGRVAATSLLAHTQQNTERSHLVVIDNNFNYSEAKVHSSFVSDNKSKKLKERNVKTSTWSWMLLITACGLYLAGKVIDFYCNFL